MAANNLNVKKCNYKKTSNIQSDLPCSSTNLNTYGRYKTSDWSKVPITLNDLQFNTTYRTTWCSTSSLDQHFLQVKVFSQVKHRKNEKSLLNLLCAFPVFLGTWLQQHLPKGTKCKFNPYASSLEQIFVKTIQNKRVPAVIATHFLAHSL